jgi:hypothetical protein
MREPVVESRRVQGPRGGRAYPYFFPWPGGVPPWPGGVPPWPGALPECPGAVPLCPGAVAL